MPNAGDFKKPVNHSHRRRPIWEQSEGDDIFVREDQPYEIDEFQTKPLKKTLIFKPHNYLKLPLVQKKSTSNLGKISKCQPKIKIKSPDEQLDELLKKMNVTKDYFDPQPQSEQLNLLEPPFLTTDGFKYCRQRASTSYAAQFKPPPPDNKLTVSFKAAYLTRDPKDQILFDFSTFKRTSFSHYQNTNKRGIFPFVYGPPLPDVRVLQSEYNLRFKNHFPLKTPAAKVNSLQFSTDEQTSTSLDNLHTTSIDFPFNQTDSDGQLWLEPFQNTDEQNLLSPTTGKCPDNKKCVKCRVRTAPNPTDPMCTCCGNPKQCLHQHLCVPMELFCSKGHYLRYSDKEIAHVCFPCPLGQYCNHRYCRYKCMSCNVGHEAAVSGATQCTECRKGFFKAEITGVECQECPYGYSTNNTGAKECTAEDGIGIDEPSECNPSLCIPCENLPPNASLDHFLCTCCPVGMCTYREKCTKFHVPCERGVLRNDASSKLCDFCPRGTYCATEICAACIPCPAGSEKAPNTYGKCQLCKPGYFKAEEDTEMCTACPSGHYSIFPGSKSCTKCPKNHFCPVNEIPSKLRKQPLNQPFLTLQSSTQPPFVCPPEYTCPAGIAFPSSKTSKNENILMKTRMFAPPSSTAINKPLIMLINLCLIYLLFLL